MTQERGAVTRLRILLATAELINERSYEKATLSDIAERAGVSKGAITHHFQNKDELGHTVIGSQGAYSQQKAMATVGKRQPAVETMLRVSADLMYDVVEDPLVQAGMRLGAEIRLLENQTDEVLDGWIDFNAMMLTTAREERTLKPDTDIPGSANLIVSALTGIILLSFLRDDIPGLPARIHEHWQSFIRANVNEPDVASLSLYASKFFLERQTRPPLTTEEAITIHLQLKTEQSSSS